MFGSKSTSALTWFSSGYLFLYAAHQCAHAGATTLCRTRSSKVVSQKQKKRESSVECAVESQLLSKQISVHWFVRSQTKVVHVEWMYGECSNKPVDRPAVCDARWGLGQIARKTFCHKPHVCFCFGVVVISVDAEQQLHEQRATTIQQGRKFESSHHSSWIQRSRPGSWQMASCASSCVSNCCCCCCKLSFVVVYRKPNLCVVFTFAVLNFFFFLR